MNIALVGYGRMGHEIESVAAGRGHVVTLIVDQDNMNDLNGEKLKEADVVIEFTQPDSAFENITRCLRLGKPVVSGTTGWLENYGKAADVCIENGTAFIHSTNFSIGVNVMFRINRELARLMAGHPEYSVSIEEVHHVRKLDAPSGTAITLANGIIGEHSAYTCWNSGKSCTGENIPVRSVREGTVPGIHNVEWDSEVDTISIRHESKSRKGLAHGAVVAAEYIHKRRGVFTMNDVLGF